MLNLPLDLQGNHWAHLLRRDSNHCCNNNKNTGAQGDRSVAEITGTGFLHSFDRMETTAATTARYVIVAARPRSRWSLMRLISVDSSRGMYAPTNNKYLQTLNNETNTTSSGPATQSDRHRDILSTNWLSTIIQISSVRYAITESDLPKHYLRARYDCTCRDNEQPCCSVIFAQRPRNTT